MERHREPRGTSGPRRGGRAARLAGTGPRHPGRPRRPDERARRASRARAGDGGRTRAAGPRPRRGGVTANLELVALSGLPEISAGDDLGALIARAAERGVPLSDDDAIVRLAEGGLEGRGTGATSRRGRAGRAGGRARRAARQGSPAGRAGAGVEPVRPRGARVRRRDPAAGSAPTRGSTHRTFPATRPSSCCPRIPTPRRATCGPRSPPRAVGARRW